MPPAPPRRVQTRAPRDTPVLSGRPVEATRSVRPPHHSSASAKSYPIPVATVRSPQRDLPRRVGARRALPAFRRHDHLRRLHVTVTTRHSPGRGDACVARHANDGLRPTSQDSHPYPSGFGCRVRVSHDRALDSADITERHLQRHLLPAAPQRNRDRLATG